MKKLGWIFSILLCLLLCSCSLFTPKEDDGGNDTPPPAPVTATLTGIQLVDEEGEKLTKATALQEFTPTAVYSHSGVFVNAIYSDNSKKDVTNSATFSAVDLTKKGSVSVTVTYKDFSEQYELTIVDNELTGIELSLWASKLVYEVGETFSTKGLVVSGIYKSGSHRVLEDYEIKITDSKNTIQNKETAFVKSDIYDITISVGTISKTYQIAVYSDQYPVTNTLDVTAYTTAEAVHFSNEGTYKPTSTATVFNDSASTLSLKDTIFRNKDVNGDSIRQTFEGKNYDAAIEVSAEKDMQLTLTKKTDLLMLVGGINGRGIVFTNTANQEKKVYSIGNVNQVASILYAQLDAGTYDMTANYGTLLLYNIDFNYTTGSGLVQTQPATSTKVTVTFAYSGPGANTLSNYTKTFDPTSDTEMRDCIVLPSGYAFVGFSQSLKTAKEGDLIKVYVDTVSSNEALVTFVGEGYESLNLDYKALLNSTIQLPTTTPPASNGKTFLNWDVSSSTIVTGNMVVKAIYSA